VTSEREDQRITDYRLLLTADGTTDGGEGGIGQEHLSSVFPSPG